MRERINFWHQLLTMRNDNFELYYIWNKEIRKIQVIEMYSKIHSKILI